MSSHSAFFLLKAIPRLRFFLRVTPTWKHREKLVEYDGAPKVSLKTIPNCKLSEDSWVQSSFPVRLGGLGINHSVLLDLSAQSLLSCPMALIV
ncbi:hypothetical protein PPYR_12457 [Photinus pyralis]|uniref:Uncharacterized protein n=1 Tax=Photinus pyralis TaxID=7054 RepID=A0A5N4AEF9_PHOPY|nr:hypothetical protein PPYR_12457 [Photinus pyralis]